MPSWELFQEQTATYQEEVFPSQIPVVGVEAGISFGWDRWADATVTIDEFGASAPGNEVMERFGFTASAVEMTARSLLS